MFIIIFKALLQRPKSGAQRRDRRPSQWPFFSLSRMFANKFITILWSRICCIPSFSLNSCFFKLHTFCVMWRRVTQKTFRFIWISPSPGSLVFFFPWNMHVQNQQWHTLDLRAKSPTHPVILWVHGTFKNKQGPAGHTRLHSDGERNGKPGKRMQEMKDTGRETVSQCPSGLGCDPCCFMWSLLF